MALLDLHTWYEVTRETNWTPTYVAEGELFPPAFSDHGIPVERWETFDEPCKVFYGDHIETQRGNDIGACSVNSALAMLTTYHRGPGLVDRVSAQEDITT